MDIKNIRPLNEGELKAAAGGLTLICLIGPKGEMICPTGNNSGAK